LSEDDFKTQKEKDAARSFVEKGKRMSQELQQKGLEMSGKLVAKASPAGMGRAWANANGGNDRSAPGSSEWESAALKVVSDGNVFSGGRTFEHNLYEDLNREFKFKNVKQQNYVRDSEDDRIISVSQMAERLHGPTMLLILV
jgi:hypothetical protein